MTEKTILHLLAYSSSILCALLIYLLAKSEAVRGFVYLVAFLCTKFIGTSVCMALLYLNFRTHSVHQLTLYPMYFYTYWSTYALEAILALMVIYSIFKLAMAPLKGLQTLGMLVFRWVAAISVAVALGVAVAPHLSGTKFIVTMVTQLQQTSSILTLCLLLFVCFAIRPMGLSYRSRIFGVSMGLGLLATTNLVCTAWFSHNPGLYSAISAFSGVMECVTLLTWSAYFAFPEPKRRMILLPTTSPFLRWNQISMALGDDPGYVAIGELPPDIFAPAELEVMRRASAKMPAALEAPATLHSLSA